MPQEITAVVEAWLAKADEFASRRHRPLVTLSYAQSIDGSISAKRGEPLLLSSSAARRLTHQLRALHDAILVGIGTVLADNPRLTVREIAGKHPQPIVLDSRLRFPFQAALFDHPSCRPWVATLETEAHPRWRELEQRGVKLLSFAGDSRTMIPWQELLEALTDWGVHSVMVEGGARVITTLLSSGLADQAVITIAPLFVGGLSVCESPFLPLGKYPAFEKAFCRSLGGDIVIWGKMRKETGGTPR
ncbi:MAG: RibD family protein [Chloroflexota bacterium]